MHRLGFKHAALTAFVVLTLAAGAARADDPKVLKITGPDGTVVVNPNGGVLVKTPDGDVKVNGGKVQVKTPDGNVRVDGGKVQVNTPGGAGVTTGAAAAGEALRYSCTGNRTVTVTGKVLTAADGVVFSASGNCTLKLKDVVVSGHVILEAKGNSDVTVQDCTFTGSSVAIDAGGNTTVKLKNTTVTAPAGIVASANSDVHVTDSTITSAETAIETRGMATVTLTRTATTGKRVSRGSSEINDK
ncbi:MAG: right-handed parallel beta-helix repeat-containing protein [Pseudomonadota bacterium]